MHALTTDKLCVLCFCVLGGMGFIGSGERGCVFIVDRLGNNHAIVDKMVGGFLCVLLLCSGLSMCDNPGVSKCLRTKLNTSFLKKPMCEQGKVWPPM